MHSDFPIVRVLSKPLMLHLATDCREGPRSSPLWFLYEEKKIWLFGTSNDSFVNRLKEDARCALSVVDFNLDKGILLHVGMRGKAVLHSIDKKRLYRFVGKYLGNNPTSWNAWFRKSIVEPIDVMISIDPTSTVSKDVSFFK